MEARKDMIQLRADLEDAQDHTNILAKEVCELTLDKSKLQDENAELVKQLDDTRCELGYERTQLARLKYRNIIRDAAPPQREHSSNVDRRLAKANDRVVVLWEEHKTMCRAIGEFVDANMETWSRTCPAVAALFDFHMNCVRKSTFCSYGHAFYALPCGTV